MLLLSEGQPLATAPRRQAARPTPRLTVDQSTKLLVIAPHPDDETLGAGGLMQRVREAGGQVHVVFLTDGDGYPEGVRYEDHVETPTPADFRGYGRQRQHEAQSALRALHLGVYTYTFLSFPDGGLCQLIHTYWSERRASYRSPYTRLNRPPRSEIIVPDTRYRGEDLTQELARIIGDYRPTLIVVPRREDQHPDHCASWFFLMDALGDVERVQPDYWPDVVNYIIHWNAWPFEDEGALLPPPPGLRGGASGWMSVPLNAAQIKAKHEALTRYQSQVHVMRWFLDGFVKANEVFSRPTRANIVLPLRRSPCCW